LNTTAERTPERLTSTQQSVQDRNDFGDPNYVRVPVPAFWHGLSWCGGGLQMLAMPLARRAMLAV
jgi:hypothetical protein